MNSVIELINNISEAVHPDHVITFLNMLQSKSDIIITTANINVIRNNVPTTELLSIIEHILSPKLIVGVSLLLSMHSDIIDRSHEGSFLIICKAYLNLGNNIKGNIQYVYHFVIKIVKRMVKIVCRMNQPRCIINTLLKVIPFIQPSAYCLSPLHADILQLCIKGQMYDHAVRFIDDNPILEIDMKACFISGLDYLRYFYYAGICYIGMKNFKVALDYLNQCISTPTEKLSEVIICAIKKAKLISLIDNGTEFSVSS